MLFRSTGTGAVSQEKLEAFSHGTSWPEFRLASQFRTKTSPKDIENVHFVCRTFLRQRV
jgi:hypothetical protein